MRAVPLRLAPALIAAVLAGCLPAREGAIPGDCDDGEDQDDDGRTDCDDPDCDDSPLCEGYLEESDADTDADTDADADTGEDTGRDTGPDTGDPPCGVEVQSTVPTAGAIDADYRAPIEFDLSFRDPTASITADFPGTLSVEDSGRLLVYTPDAPLSPSTTYTATLSYCGGEAALSFTTSALGTPLATDLVGRTWRMSSADVRITAPSGVGPVLGGYLDDDALLGVTAVAGGQIDLLATTAGRSGQDLSVNTLPLAGADFSESPYFATAPTDLSVSVAGYPIPAYGVVLSGTFASDGSYIGGVSGTGTFDTRPLAPLLDDSGDVGAICDLAVSFGALCEPCVTDGEPYCLAFAFDQGVAIEEEGVSLVEVTGGTGCAAIPVGGALPGGAALSLAGLGLLGVRRRR